MKKTDKDIIATNQLIKVIRGESSTLMHDTQSQSEEGIIDSKPNNKVKISNRFKIALVSLLIGMMFFTFFSIYYFTGDIGNLENIKEYLEINSQKIAFPVEPSGLWKHKKELSERIDAASRVLTVNRPYVSSLLKELSIILPKNCFLNRLHIFLSSKQTDNQDTTFTMEATIIEDSDFSGFDLADIVNSIDASPLFGHIKVGYQDRSELFDYRTINFQVSFSLE
ncbi:hypothetical protein JXL19_06955 [bacterium]|nr:hypothetical protein [bacterium]